MEIRKHLPLALATLAVITTLVLCTARLVTGLTDIERVLYSIDVHTDTTP